MGSTATNEMDTNLISELRRYSRQLVREWGFMSPTAAGTAYTASAVHALIEISHNEGLMSAELCGLLNLDKSSISRVVKKLVEAGELEEEFDGGAAGKGDGRVKRLVLTAKGKETVRGIDSFGNQQVSTALSRLPRDAFPSTILTGIRAYATALLSHRLNPAPTSTNQNPPIILPSEPKIQIVTGYRLSLIASTIALQLSYYGPNNGFGLEFEVILAKAMAELLPRLDGEKNEVWCAVQGEKIMGCVWIDGERLNLDVAGGAPKTSFKRAALRFFIVSPHLQGKGIGRQLISRAVAFCDEKGFEECELSTFKGLDIARKLYESVGFREVGEKRYKPWGHEILQQYLVRKKGGM